MSNTESIVLVISLSLLGIGFSLMIEGPFLWMLGFLLVLIVCIGTDRIIYGHWRVNIRRRRYMVTLWILPSLVVLGSLLLLRSSLFSNGLWIAFGLIVTGFLLAFVIYGEYMTVDPTDLRYRTARIILNIISYITLFAIFIAIYGTKVRSLVTATVIFLAATLIALELLREGESKVQQSWLYSLITGLLIGQITWTINYWTIPAIVGGAFLLLIFYVTIGIVQNYLSKSLNLKVIIEYGVVSTLGLGIIFGSFLISNYLS